MVFGNYKALYLVLSNAFIYIIYAIWSVMSKGAFKALFLGTELILTMDSIKVDTERLKFYASKNKDNKTNQHK